MLAALEQLRTRLAGRPLLLWFGALALLAIWRSVRAPAAPRPQACRATVSAAAVAALVGYAGIALWYAANQYFFDNAEPTIPSVAWAFRSGQPLYHALDAAERYSHIYGPLAFIPHAVALGAFAADIRVSKAVGVAAALASLAITFAICRTRAGTVRGAAVAGLAALALLMFRNESFWTRPDPLQLLAASMSLALAMSARGAHTDVLSGMAAGLAWDVRLTGPLYALMPLAIVVRRGGPARVALACAAGIVVAALPFALCHDVSLVNYAAWLRASGRTGLLFSTLRQNIEWAMFLGAPLILARAAGVSVDRYAEREWNVRAGALAAGIGAVAIAGAKPGAGPYHLLPFVPGIAYLATDRIGRAPLRPDALQGLAAWAVVAVFVAALGQIQFTTAVAARAAVGDAEEIRGYLDGHPGVVEMGYGSTESLSHERPVVVFRTRRYFLDQPAVREYALQGLEIPASTIDGVAGCRVQFWLIPRGERPFGGGNSYTEVLGRPLYSEAFRSAFLRTHRLTGSTPHFDVWACVGNGAR